MSVDTHANWATSLVKIPPSPADSGLTLSVKPGEGILFPEDDGFNCVVWQAGVQSSYYNSEIVRVTAVPRSTIDAPSDGDVLPQATINVVDEASFNAGGGTAGILLSDGSIAVIQYTAAGSDQLTGCTLISGSGTLHTGDKVVGDDFTVTRTAENAANGLASTRSIVLNDQIEAAITKKSLTDAEVGGGGSSEQLAVEMYFPNPAFSDAGIGTARFKIPNDLVGGGSPDGTAAEAKITPPYIYAPNDIIVSALELALNGEFPSTADFLDITISVTVTDLTGTNKAQIQVSVPSGSSPTSTVGMTVDITGGTWTIVAGTDLVDIGGGQLKTTAGGLYIGTATCQVGWD